MRFFYKANAAVNLVTAILAGSLMMFDPATFRQGNIDTGIALGDPAASLNALPLDPVHIRFTAAGVLCIGAVGSFFHLTQPSRPLTLISSLWMLLTVGIMAAEYRHTGLLYVVPLLTFAAVHAAIYSHQFLTWEKRKES